MRDDGFVSLAAALSPPAEVAADAESPSSAKTATEDDRASNALDELKFARLAALEAYDRAVPRLLDALVHEVLGRELALVPVDLAALAAGLRAEFAACEPVALVVAPGDAGSIAADFPVRVDPTLHPGDLMLDVRDGQIDARLAIRHKLAIESSLDS